MHNRERGRDIEARVRDFLIERGLEPLASNWRCRVGEIDLVMRDPAPLPELPAERRGTVVFVEVRYRRHHALGGGLASVDARKRARLRRAALAWLQRHGDIDRPARIDVVAVGPRTPDTASCTAATDRARGAGDGEGNPIADLAPDLRLEWVVDAVAGDA